MVKVTGKIHSSCLLMSFHHMYVAYAADFPALMHRTVRYLISHLHSYSLLSSTDLWPIYHLTDHADISL